MVGWIDTVQGCPQHRDGCTVSGQTAAMGCSINPFRKTTKDGPTLLGQNTAQFFSHGKTMIRGGTHTHQRDGFTGMDVSKQRSIPFDVEPGRGCLHIIQARRPTRITRQKGTSRHVKLRSSPVLEPVTLNVAQTVRRPSQRMA